MMLNILTDQDALVEVAVALLQAYSDDASILSLRVVSRGKTGRGGSHGCQRNRASMSAGWPGQCRGGQRYGSPG